MKKMMGRVKLSMAILVIMLLLTGLGQAALMTTEALPILSKPFLIAGSAEGDESQTAAAFDDIRRQFVVVYQDETDVMAVCLSNRGQKLAEVTLGAGQNPDISFGGNSSYTTDNYLAVWENTGDIFASRIGGDCSTWPDAVGPAFVLSDDRTGTEVEPAVAFSSDEDYPGYQVVWEDNDESPAGRYIWGRRVAPEPGGGDEGGEVVGASFGIATTTGADHYDADLVYNRSANEFMTVYSRETSGASLIDIYARGIANTPAGDLTQERGVDTTNNDQLKPAIAVNELNSEYPYFVVYIDYYGDAAGDIRGIPLDSNAVPAPDYLSVAITAAVPEVDPAIANNRSLGGYYVVWAQQNMIGFPQEPVWNVYGRQVNSDGTLGPVTDVSHVNEAPYGDNNTLPAIADGSTLTLVAWDSDGFGTETMDIAGIMLGYITYLPLVRK